MHKLLILFGIFWGSPLFAAPGAAKLAPCDTWYPAQGAARAVVLLTHGLNLRPNKMDELARFLAQNRFEVFRPAFTGHCNDNKKYLEVQATDWEADARRFHEIAETRAHEFGVPLYLCAYSFSTAVFQVMSAELPFAKRAYFAPALATRFWYPLVVWLAGLWPSLTFRSLVPEGYFANERSGQRSLLAYDVFYRRWEKGEGRDDPTPTIGWIDPADELVSSRGLSAVAKAKPSWSLRELRVEGSTLPKKYHHLIIDEAALGPKEWARVTGELKEFLDAKK